jgi:hypothetical protein
MPVEFGAAANPLSVAASSSIVATCAAQPSPAVSINVNTARPSAGSFQESVTLQETANPNATLVMPLALTVSPQVSFTLATNQVNIRFRQGQQHTLTSVAITPNFGSEYFSFNVTSSASWLYGWVDQSSATSPVLTINTVDQAPGTYDATLTVGLQGLQNANQVVAVHYVVDPPATIHLSASTVSLHVVQGQPAPTVAVQVTGSTPGVVWSIFAGMQPVFLNVTQSTTARPGQIQVTVDRLSSR